MVTHASFIFKLDSALRYLRNGLVVVFVDRLRNARWVLGGGFGRSNGLVLSQTKKRA